MDTDRHQHSQTDQTIKCKVCKHTSTHTYTHANVFIPADIDLLQTVRQPPHEENEEHKRLLADEDEPPQYAATTEQAT